MIAFFAFKNNAWNVPNEKFSDLLQNKAVAKLLTYPEVMKFTKIIDRDMQNALLQQQIGSMNAMMDDESRVEIGELLNANIFITGTIDSATLEGPSTNMRQEHRRKEFQNENIQSDGTSYTTVEIADADLYIYTKSVKFRVTVTYKAIDVETGAILMSNTVSAYKEDISEWADYSGNSAALTGRDNSLIHAREKDVLPPSQIAADAADEIGETLATDLANLLK